MLKGIQDEDGSTLVETLVAMAILVSVLLPTSLFLGYIASNPLNKDKVTALGIAQSEMEQVLANKDYANNEEVIKGNWIIDRRISEEENLVLIRISIYRKDKPEPVITLNTERLQYQDNVSK